MRRLVYLVAAVIATACSSLPFGSTMPRPEWWAFTAPWDRRSDSSERVNAARLDGIDFSLNAGHLQTLSATH